MMLVRPVAWFLLLKFLFLFELITEAITSYVSVDRFYHFRFVNFGYFLLSLIFLFLALMIKVILCLLNLASLCTALNHRTKWAKNWVWKYDNLNTRYFTYDDADNNLMAVSDSIQT